MHRPASMFVLLSVLCCFLFLATHAHDQKPRPAANNGRSTTVTGASCIPHERDALLAFKHGVTSDPAGVLSSWRRDGEDDEQDCCRWRGVRCSNRTGHVRKLQLAGTGLQLELEPDDETALVGQISPSLIALEHLDHLDLSFNKLEGSNGRLPEFLCSLKNLKYLNLSGIPFRGSVPPQLGNLTKLQYLDLSTASNMKSSDLSWLTRLPSIEYLNLNGVKLSTAVGWSHVINMIPSLRVLGLSGCSLASANQPLPHLNLTKLEELDASSNSFNHSVATSWFWNITSLKYLYLGYTSMYGQLPGALGDMTSLKILDLSNFDDEKNLQIMNIDLTSLCNLEVLMLESAFSQGNLTELFRNLPRCSPNKLQEMHLGYNQLPGTLPRWIGQLTSLVVLDLHGNNITGPIPTNVGGLTGLQTLHLSENHLSGNVPYEIGMLSNLTSLDLSNNKLDGVITEEHFASTRILQHIDLSYNALKIELSSDWQPPSTLSDVYLIACQMGPIFPRWLQWHAGITSLDISSAGIADPLPQWFADTFLNLKFLDISNNQLIGALPTNMGFMSLEQLYLSSNQLTGQIPTMPPNIAFLDLSYNSLRGPLPSDIGSGYLTELRLFSNQITGHIPESLCKYQQLDMMDLSNNFLEGEVPPCLGVLEDIEFIDLSNNSFSGDFPSFVQNCTAMFFLDLSWNKFSGSLPMWIGKLVSLRILRLSHNNFSGNIPENITNLACLQYMDLSSNGISGSLPSNLSNLNVMRYSFIVSRCVIDSYPFHMSIVWKGQGVLDYGSLGQVFYTNMMSIDLSSNSLTGEIPEEIIALDALVNLNLSRNNFSGVVPNKIGEMQSLESLDLSRNKLSGEIPATLPNLTFLSYLDLSYNNLNGRIPSGSQLDTLYAANPSMYIGNIGLCGRPLPKDCSSEGNASKQGGLGRGEESYGIEFFYLGLGCGFVVGIWMAFGALLFKRSWRIACFQLPDKLYEKVCVLVATWARRKQID